MSAIACMAVSTDDAIVCSGSIVPSNASFMVSLLIFDKGSVVSINFFTGKSLPSKFSISTSYQTMTTVLAVLL